MSSNSDLLVSRDVLGFIKRFLDKQRLCFPVLIEELNRPAKNHQLKYTPWQRIIESSTTGFNKKFIGINIGQSINAQDCGVLGYLFQSSATLLHALSAYQRYHALLYSGVSFHLAASTPSTTVVFWQFKQPFLNETFEELIASSLVALMNNVLHGSVITPKQLNFRHPINSEDIEYYQTVFGCPVKGNCLNLEIIFDSAEINQTLLSADIGLHSILEAQAQLLTEQAPQSDDFIANLKDGIIQSIRDGNPNVEYVADILSTSPRTLHRKLEQRNLKFRTILRDVRKTLAENYLAQENLSIVEVAFLLGYSEQSTFTRAFSNWHGTTPAQYRKNLQKRTRAKDFFYN